jgi:branched-chain amino acid transport system ATP-binding protein
LLGGAVLLEVRNVSRAFGGVQAVDDVSFSIAEGDIVGMIGPNGAGKTTITSLLTGMVQPDRGDILLKGESVLGLKPHEICRRGLTKTFQITRPFAGLSATENVMVAALAAGISLRAARERAREILRLVGLGHRLEAPAEMLSTGQRKRLEFARSLGTGAKLVLLDEPFGGVDQRGIPELVEVIRHLREVGTTLVLIDHNLQVVRQLSDHIIALHLGRKIAEGDPDEVMDSEAVAEAHMGRSDLLPMDVTPDD